MSNLRPRKGKLTCALLLYMIAAVGLLVSSQITSSISQLIQSLNPCIQLLICDCIYYIPFIALPALIALRVFPDRTPLYRTEGFSLWKIPVIAALAASMFILCNDITVLWAIPFQKLGLDLYAFSGYTPANASELVIYVISAAAIPAICEEFLLRGILLSALERFGTKRAAVITTILFATLHGSVLGIPAELLAGAVIVCVTLSANSLYAGMIFHTLYNTITIVVDFMQQESSGGDILTQLNGLAGVFSLAVSCFVLGLCVYLLLRALLLSAKFRKEMLIIPNVTPPRLSAVEIILILLSAIAIVVLYIMTTMAMM